MLKPERQELELALGQEEGGAGFSSAHGLSMLLTPLGISVISTHHIKKKF